jgi:putative heme iron utilization protein
MGPEDLELLRRLLVEQPVLAIAVVVDGEPVAGLLPFLSTPDRGALVVHASRLARHSAGLADGARWSAVIHSAAGPGDDPLQVPRVTLHGRALSVDNAGPERARLEQAWLARFPSASLTVGLGDFAFHRLEIEGGRLVAGFARALNLSRETLSRLG